MPNLQPLSEDERSELIAYLDGELDPKLARRVEVKLNTDPRVRAEADALKRTWALLDYLPRPDPSPNFTHRTVDRLSTMGPGSPLHMRRPAWRRWALGIGWAAALLLVGVAGYAGAPWVAAAYRGQAGDPASEAEQLARDLRTIEQLRLLQNANDFQFANELDRPELFGDDHSGF